MANEKTTAKTTEVKAVKKTPKPPEIPSIDSFQGPAQDQFKAVLVSSKQFVDAIKNANAVPLGTLREVRRAIYIAITDDLKGRKPDPKTKKMEALRKKIQKAQEELKALGIA